MGLMAMSLREDTGRCLTLIDGLARRHGRARVDDLAREAGIGFGRTCAIVSRLSREQLIRHLPHSGIFMTERGRSRMAREAA